MLKRELDAQLAPAVAAWQSGDPARLAEGLQACEQAVALLRQAAPAALASETPPPELAGLAAAVWLQRGHLFECRAAAAGETEALQEALRSYDRAVDLFRRAADATPVDLAGACMNRGNALQRVGSPAALEEAVRCYDETLELLAALPAEAPVEFYLMRGSAWLNRGGAHLRLGGEQGRAEAVRSFERSVAELEPWTEAHPAARRHLGSAWTNLGLMRLERGDPAGAVAAHEQALAVSAPRPDEDGGPRLAERAAILLNLGQARHAADDRPGALAVLREAIAVVASRERTDPAAADVALRARHAACVTLGGTISARAADAGDLAAVVAEAGDLAEEGLALARAWDERGGWFRETSLRLFVFGAWLYRTQQPQFLAEFLTEHLGDDPGRVAAARAAVGLARQQILGRGFESLVSGEPASRAVAMLRELRELEERLEPKVGS